MIHVATGNALDVVYDYVDGVQVRRDCNVMVVMKLFLYLKPMGWSKSCEL